MDFEALKKDPMEEAEEILSSPLLDLPKSPEAGLRRGDSGVFIRGDGALELHAGPVSLVLDPHTAAVYASADNFVGRFRGSHFIVEDDGFGVRGQKLNPQWFGPTGWQKDVLGPASEDALGQTYLTGVPATGQTSVPFSRILARRQLFLKKEELGLPLLERIKELGV